LSSLTPKNSEIALKALELGAIEVICKSGAAFSAQDISRPLVHAIRAAASAKIQLNQTAPKAVAEKVNYDNLLGETTHKVVAIGASTGGTKAIETILRDMPATCPGTVIVQHMPEAFTASFAERLNDLCEMEVHEARDNEYVVPGVALIAPGNYHMVLRRSGANYLVKIKNGPPVYYQRPAVDVLFQSVAKSAGRNAVGVLLTGMGVDGAKGLLSMSECGAYTMAQDEETSIVFGMPREAIRIGAVDKVFPLQEIPMAIINALQNQKKVKQKSYSGN